MVVQWELHWTTLLRCSEMDRWMDHASHATAGIHGERKQIKDGREAGENN
jgi:hypothetical protein